MTVNTCQNCHRSFHCHRSDKRFCSASCRWAHQQNSAKTTPMPSEATLALGLALQGNLPDGTVGYRLGLKLAKGLFWFPSQTGKSLRWDDSFSNRPYFLLTAKDFEPPRVPKAGVYVIHFLDAQGEQLVTPEMFLGGVQVTEASRMSWPGTHQVRKISDGRVRSVVELSSGRSPGRARVRSTAR